MNLIKNTGYLLPLFMIVSCQKAENTDPQPSEVTVNVQKPQQGQTFKKGDTVYINANIRYISELHGYTVNITDSKTARILFTTSEHAHTDSFQVSSFWIDTLSQEADLKLTIETEIDHDGNVASKDVTFHSQP